MNGKLAWPSGLRRGNEEERARGRRFESGVGQLNLQSGPLYEIVLFIFYILDRDFFKKKF